MVDRRGEKGVNLEFELVTIFKDIGEQQPICNAKQMTSVPVLKNKQRDCANPYHEIMINCLQKYTEVPAPPMTFPVRSNGVSLT